MSTVDVLTIITKVSYHALDKNSVTQAMALDISKSFEKFSPADFPHKLKGYSVSGRIFDLIQYFL